MVGGKYTRPELIALMDQVHDYAHDLIADGNGRDAEIAADLFRILGGRETEDDREQRKKK